MSGEGQVLLHSVPTGGGEALAHQALHADPHIQATVGSPGRARLRTVAQGLLTVVMVTASGALTTWLAGRAALAVWGDKQGLWILGRSAGVTSYLLLVALVLLGLALSHPWRTRWPRPSTVTRVRLHAGLGVFTLCFTVLHVVVLAMDSYAGVGLRGALVPMQATYRPVPVTLGVLGAYAGILAGVTASMAGRVQARVWWPLHKVAAVVLVLVWAHGLLSGSDSAALRLMYAGTGLVVVLVAVSRYMATTPADRFESLRSRADGR